MPLESGEIFGLRLTIVGGNEGIVINPGRCRDAEDRGDIEVPLEETRIVNPAVAGLGGLDTGVIAAKTSYALYLVKSGNTVEGLLSRSFDPLGANPPQFPQSASLRYRRIGAVATDANAKIVPFFQQGNREDRQYRYSAEFAQLAVVANGQATDFTDFDLAPFYHGRADLAQLAVGPGNGVAVTVRPKGPGGGPTLTLDGFTIYGFRPSDDVIVTVGQYRNDGPGGNTRIAVLGFSETL